MKSILECEFCKREYKEEESNSDNITMFCSMSCEKEYSEHDDNVFELDEVIDDE